MLDTTCPGCRKGTGRVCPECEELARSDVAVSRLKWPTWLAIVGIPLIAVGVVLFLRLDLHGGMYGRGRGLWLIPGAGIAWILGLVQYIRWSFYRPVRLQVLRDGVEFTMFLGKTRLVPLAAVESRLGNIKVRTTGEQHPVRGLRYRGAEKFHRALRAMQGLAAANC